MYSDLRVEIEGWCEAIFVRLGLKQGCPCSPVLFSLYFDRVATALEHFIRSQERSFTPHTLRILSLQMTLLLYADDVAIIAPTEHGLRSLFTAFESFCSTEHLTISEKKTKVLISSATWTAA